MVGRKLKEVKHCTTPCLVSHEKNEALGVLVKMMKIMQVWGSYVIKRGKELSLGGRLRGSIEKECNMLKDEQQVKKK